MSKPEPPQGRIIREDFPFGIFVLPLLWGLLIVLVAIASGCATAPQQVQVTSGATSLPPQKIPVLVPCMTADKVPMPPATWMRTGQSREKLETAAAADLAELNIYIVKSQSAMWACVESLKEEK